MNSAWDRNSTREWITQLTNRVDDVAYYKKETTDWISKNEITDVNIITKSLIATCIWVSYMRQEPISFGEICDFLGISIDIMVNPTVSNIDDLYEISDPEYAAIELNDILKEILKENTQ